MNLPNINEENLDRIEAGLRDCRVWREVKCKRCSYCWLPGGNIDCHKTGRLYMLSLGICSKCGSAKPRLEIATPGDIVNAMLWGQKFEVKRKE